MAGNKTKKTKPTGTQSTKIEINSKGKDRENLNNEKDESDVALIDIQFGADGSAMVEESRLISLTPDQSNPTGRLDDEFIQNVINGGPLEGDMIMSSTQKSNGELGRGRGQHLENTDSLDLSIDENCPCEECGVDLGKQDVCAECDKCKRWYCQKCIINKEKSMEKQLSLNNKKQVCSQMETIKMTETVSGLFWFCKNCTEEIRKALKEGIAKKDESQVVCEGCKKGAIQKDSTKN